MRTQMSFVDDTVTVEEARAKGHMHIADFVAHAHKFQVRVRLYKGWRERTLDDCCAVGVVGSVRLCKGRRAAHLTDTLWCVLDDRNVRI